MDNQLILTSTTASVPQDIGILQLQVQIDREYVFECVPRKSLLLIDETTGHASDEFNLRPWHSGPVEIVA